MKYCLKIDTVDFSNHYHVVRRYFYKDISELNIILSRVFPSINLFFIHSAEVEKL